MSRIFEMLTGDELLHKRDRFLCELFDQGAISPDSAAAPDTLRRSIDVSEQDFTSLYILLHQAELIIGAPYSVLYLTNLGLKEVEAIRKVNRYHLTDRQKELLWTLVKHIREDNLQEPIHLYGSLGIGRYFQLRGGEKFVPQGDVVGDLTALCDVDLMSVRLTSKGKELYSIKQAGYDAVDSDFEIPSSQSEIQLNIGAIIGEMSGGNLQTVGSATNAKLSQIVNDPALLQSQVEDLTEKLLDEVKATLTGTDLIEYVKSVQDLREQLSVDTPDPSLLKRLAGKLAFLADIEGTIALMARVWPYLYLLLLIAAKRLGQ